MGGTKMEDLKNYVIYKAYDTKNGMIYIGMTKNFKKRKTQHHNDQRRPTHFHRALAKRPQDFEWLIIESELSFEQAKEREMYWIQHYDSFYNGYNETLGGDGTQGLCGPLNHFYGKHHTEETKKKIANRDYSHMYGPTNPNANGQSGKKLRGRHLSEETKAKLSEAHRRGWQNKSPEEKKRISEACSKRYSGKGNPMYGVKRDEEHGWYKAEYITSTGKVGYRWKKLRKDIV